MKIGIPKENKVLEQRVSLIPEAVGDIVSTGHKVFVQTEAGCGSGYADEAYQTVGAQIVPDISTVYEEAELIVKVKDPIEEDLELLQAHHTLFSFLHLAPQPELIQRLCDIGLTAIGFETITDEHVGLPLLAPMSQIAGKIAIQVGTHLLHGPQGGRGIMLGGMPDTEKGQVVVLGGGNAGASAALLAAALGANVIVFDKNMEKMALLQQRCERITPLFPYNSSLAEEVRRADLLIGAVLIPGAEAPKLVSQQMVEQMQPGSVIIDISVDQGGCIETIRPTDYASPTYTHAGVLHFGVTNMPGAVPRTASQALSSALMPYVLQLARDGYEAHSGLQNGLQIRAGEVCHEALKGLI